ncbi:MAG: GTP 3',8-cyclase MoaA [Magnetospiraceae bacterium]
MQDPFGRTITYLRVSVTDRCDFRCHYCMAEEMTFLPRPELLTFEELDRVCSAFIDRGVRKLRLTGGEPLTRRGIMELFERLSRHLNGGGLEELTLTTNGSQLAKYAKDLYRFGVRRVNISLDSLNAETFRAITRIGSLEKVLEGVAAAKEAGLKVKINTVALGGIIEKEIDALISWCGSEGFDLTLIETMPLGDIGGERVTNYLPLDRLRADLMDRWTFSHDSYTSGGPARYQRIAETGGRIGFITPMTEHFCDTCNRVRLTCTGRLYMCLGQEDHVDLRAAVRQSESNAPLFAAIDRAIGQKPKGHEFVIDETYDGPALSRHMNVTGG